VSIRRRPPSPKNRRAAGSINAPSGSFSPDPMPEEIPISVDIAGEKDMGKTHFAATFPPKCLFLDNELKAPIVLRKFKARGIEHIWKKVKSFRDIREGVYWAIDSGDEIKTVVFDSGALLQKLAVIEWSEEHGGKKPIVIDKITGTVSTYLYAQVYEKIDSLITLLKDNGKNIVVTSRMKDEWIMDKPTGRRVRDGFKHFPWDLQIGLIIRKGIKDWNSTKVYFPEIKFAEVTKNNYWGVDLKRGITQQKPVLFDISYEGVVNELVKPWHGEEGVPLGKEMETLIAEAEEWVKRIHPKAEK